MLGARSASKGMACLRFGLLQNSVRQQTALLQESDKLNHQVLRRFVRAVDRQLGLQRRLVGVVNAREAHALAARDGSAGLLVESLRVALFANVDRRGDVD